MSSQEKSAFPVTNALPIGGQHRKKTWPLRNLLLAILLAGGISILSRNYISGHSSGISAAGSRTGCSGYTYKNDSDHFDWDKLTPSPVLHWVACYEAPKQCARLEVPLDYAEPDGEKAAIALLKIPAKVGPNDASYKGPILFNPGGPGGSGVDFMFRWGSKFPDILGDEYDIVGFDPRGIGYTKPSVEIFDTDLDRAAWDIREKDAPIINETSTAMAQIVARAKLMNRLIDERAQKAAKHVNTAVVCRDMLSIVQAHGYEKLQYWGFSYGSVLGATFATLFPDNVGKLAIDGVDDADDYYEGLWGDNLRDTDKGLDMVFEQCSESKDECPLYEPTADAVKERYLRLLAKVDEEPVQLNMGGDYTLIRRKHLHENMFLSLYQPYARMKKFFSALHGLESGNSTLLQEVMKSQYPTINCHCGAKPALPNDGYESGVAVMCTDAGPKANDRKAFQRHFQMLANMSHFGDIWSMHYAACIGWNIEPAHAWRGPIGANTSFPLLVVGNTADPVTPYAVEVSKRFPASALLIQNSAGHCSLAATSLCTAKAVRRYFREGLLPAKGIRCEIEDHMFLNPRLTINNAMDEEDAKILEALRAMRGKTGIGEALMKH